MPDNNSDLSAPLHDYIGLSHISPSPPPPPPPHSPDLSLDLDLGLALSAPSPKDLPSKPIIDRSSIPEFLSISSQKNASAKRGYSDAISDARDSETGLETKSAIARNLQPPTTPTPTPPPQQQQQQQQQQQKQPQQPSFHPTWAPAKPTVPSWHSVSMEKPSRPPFKPENATTDASSDVPPPPKDRVVGWPPVRSHRRQKSLANPAEMFVKVNMDGIAVGRKVDLHSYDSYEGLLRALQDMFQPSNTGAVQGACPAPPGRDKNFLLSPGSEFVLTYEDKDGDWMLVGDVPWSMFISTVKRLRITRRSESTAPVSRGTDNNARFTM